jgi:hypothetical protein
MTSVLRTMRTQQQTPSPHLPICTQGGVKCWTAQKMRRDFELPDVPEWFAPPIPLPLSSPDDDRHEIARPGGRKGPTVATRVRDERTAPAFPDLRAVQHSHATSRDGSRRGRRVMTAAERRSVSVRMKKYWAGRRKKNGASQARAQPTKRFWQAQRHLRCGSGGDCCGSEKTLGGDSETGQSQDEGHGRELRRQRVDGQPTQSKQPTFRGRCRDAAC